MKIIEQGKKPKLCAWQGRYRCYACGTVIELDEGDRDLLIALTNHDHDLIIVTSGRLWKPSGLLGVEVLIRCPTCEQERTLRLSDEDEIA